MKEHDTQCNTVVHKCPSLEVCGTEAGGALGSGHTDSTFVGFLDNSKHRISQDFNVRRIETFYFPLTVHSSIRRYCNFVAYVNTTDTHMVLQVFSLV